MKCIKPDRMVKSMQDLAFKTLEKGNLERSAEIINSAFAPVSKQFGFQHEEDISQIISRLEENLLFGSIMLGAFLEEEQIGFVEIQAKDEEVYEVTKLSVTPEQQRKGYGQAILNKAQEMIMEKGGVAVVCVVIDDNKDVKDWVLRNGFYEEASGQIPNLPCTVCLLQKDIENPVEKE